MNMEVSMKRRAKTVWVVAGLVMFTALLTGCNKKSDSGGGAKPISVTFWHSNEIHERFFDAGVKEWNAAYADRPVEVTFENYPNQEMGSKLLIAIQSGTGAPDIADININYFANFLQGQIQLAPLNKIVDPVKSQFIQSRFDCYSKNGTVYGLPTHVGATVVYYNKELCELAGIDIDKIETWAQFEEAGRTYLAKTGKPFVGVETGNQRPFWPMIVQRGGDYLDKNGNVVLDSAVNIDVLSQMNRWYNADKIAVGFPGGSTAVEETFAFINNGGVAAVIMPMWYMSRFTSYMPDLKGKIYLRALPVMNPGDARSAGIGGTGTAVTLQSDNVDFCVDLLGHLKLTKEANIRFWTYAQFDPPRWDVWDAPELQAPDPYFGGEKVFDMLLRYKDNIPSPNYGDLSAAAQDVVMNNVMYNALIEKQNPAAVLKAAADELRSK
jgi:arabinosaccharide transport system substrate-binding protein